MATTPKSTATPSDGAEANNALPFAVRVTYASGAHDFNPSPTQRRAEAVIGEPVAFTFGIPAFTFAVSIERKPPTSTASIRRGEFQFVPDVPGVYVVRIAIGGGAWHRDLEIVALNEEQLRRFGPRDVWVGGGRRQVARAALADPRATFESLTRGLETAAPPSGSIFAGFSPVEFGGPTS